MWRTRPAPTGPSGISSVEDPLAGPRVAKSTSWNIPLAWIRSVRRPPSVGVKSTWIGMAIRCLQMGLASGSAGLETGMAQLSLMCEVAWKG